MVPVPIERKAKIESQIKSGLNRFYREIQREEEEKPASLAAVAMTMSDD